MHTLEATLFLCIMFGSIAAMATWNIAPTPAVFLDETLEQRAEEQLAIWGDQPIGGGACSPRSQLDGLVFDGLADRHTTWGARSSTFGPATRSDMVMLNGEGLYPLHGPGDIVGASRNVWWTPDQDFAMALPSTNPVSGLEHLHIEAPALRWGVGARIAAEALSYSAEFTSPIGPSTVVRSAPIAMHAGPDGRPSTNISWRATDGRPALSLTFEPTDIGPRGASLRLVVAGGETVPPGGPTVLRVEIPRGWGMEWEHAPEEWTLSGNPLRAEMAGPFAAEATFTLLATIPVSAGRPPDVVRAHLTGGALGESNLVVTYPASTERNLPRYIETTTPYPVARGEWTTLGGVVVNGGDSISVDTFRIEVPGGYDLDHNDGEGAPLFAAISPEPPADPLAELDPEHLLNEPATGWMLGADGRSIVWRGAPIEIEPFQAHAWYVRVRITDDPLVTTAIEPAWSNGPKATLVFSNGYAITSDQWGKSPGVIRFRVPPASVPMDDPAEPGGSADGYPWKLAPFPGDEERVLLWANGTLAHLTNETTYALAAGSSDVVSFEHAASNASLQVADRRVPVGSVAWLSGDVSSLMTTLSENGIESSLTIELYAPPSMGCAPTRAWRIASASLPAASAQATHVWDGGSGVPSVFVATEDGFVHRVDASGGRLWSTGATAAPTLLARMAPAAGAPHILAGTSSGDVQAFLAGDGDLRWTSSVVDGGGSSAAEATALVYDAARGHVLAGSALGDIVVLDDEGDRLADERLAGAVIDIIPEPDGAGYVLTSQALYRFADLGTLTVDLERPLVAVGMARGADHLLLAYASEVALLDPTTLAEEGSIPMTAVEMTSRGDITGDGQEDLALGRVGLRLSVVDGASGAALPQFEYDLSASPVDPDVFTAEEVATVAGDAALLCNGGAPFLSYQADVACSMGSDRILDIQAGDGVLGVAYTVRGSQLVAAYGADGARLWESTASGVPGALGTGEWLLDSPISYAEGNGLVIVRGALGQDYVVSTPSERVGLFRLPIPVPQGGFYGTHLVVARLQWTGAAQELQEARLVDWFEAVSMTGDPVVRPSYRIALTLEQIEEPFALRPGET